ncbi:MAG: phospholipase D-like domain-containing protein, partial [Candidatus Neptunochlamydia sp.]|nr:phospholipase D-like domain-containing protein [Candidatus Neptunochlamydia sp.]
MLKVKKFSLVLSPVLIGLFLFSFLLFYSLHIHIPSDNKPLIFYNSEKRVDLNQLLKKTLYIAQESVILHTYAFTDLSLLSLLKKQAEKGVSIHIHYDKKVSPSLHLLEKENFHFHPTEGKGLIHEKLWIIDEKILFIGSTNLTPSSLKMHDNLMVGLYVPPLAKVLSQGRPEAFHLETDWAILHTYCLPSKQGLEALLESLDQAKKEIFLSLFTFTHPQIAEKLIQLHKKGVKIHLKLDRGTARGASKNIKKLFESEGIPVQTSHGLQLYHHKWATIDQKTHIIGSAN